MAPRSRRSLLRLGGAALPIALGGCVGSSPSGEPFPSDTSSWPQDGSDPGHTGVTPATGIPERAEVTWKLDLKRPVPPLVVGDKLVHHERLDPESDDLATATNNSDLEGFSPDANQHLVCRDTKTADIRWLRPITVGRGPVIADDHVIDSAEGSVVAFHINDGTEVWRQDLGRWSATVSTAVDGIVIAPTSRYDIRAYSVADGTRKWKRSVREKSTRIAAAGNTVFSLSYEFKVGSVLTAHRIDDGAEQWSVELENGLPGWPVVAGERVYVGPSDEGVVAFDRATGEQRWQSGTGGMATVAASASTAYLGDREGLHVRDAMDGSPRWSVAVGDDETAAGFLAVDSETMYVAGSSDLLALSREDGSERWRHTFPEVTVGDVVASGLWGQPTVVDGTVYACSEDGLYRFDRAE